MKISAFFLGLALLATAGVAQAATLSVAPATVSVVAGQTVTLSVIADAGAANLYTIEAALTYPTDLLEYSSFNLGSGWIAVTKQGYDQAGGGVVYKTAGFPGGFTGQKTLGTITFIAKATGTATVGFSSASLAYDSQNQNQLSGAQNGSQITIASAPARTTTTASTATEPSSTVTDTSTTTETAATTTETAPTQAAAAVTAGFSMPLWGWLLILAAVLAIGSGWFFWQSRKKA